MHWLPRLFFVPDCPACGRPLEEGRALTGDGVFCAACALACAPMAPPWCPHCGLPVAGEGACARCLRDPPPFAGAFAALPYEGPVRSAIRRGKYGPAPWVFGRLGPLLTPLVAAVGPAVIVPMPVTPSAWRARGFSPPAQLAAAASRELDRRAFPVRALLRRTRDVPAQASLTLDERQKLSPDEFAVTGPVADLRLLLIDDVVTTGATVGAATRALLAAGAREVWVVSLARTL
jgi:predicted amidophosphoribosyltransferase